MYKSKWIPIYFVELNLGEYTRDMNGVFLYYIVSHSLLIEQVT